MNSTTFVKLYTSKELKVADSHYMESAYLPSAVTHFTLINLIEFNLFQQLDWLHHMTPQIAPKPTQRNLAAVYWIVQHANMWQ